MSEPKVTYSVDEQQLTSTVELLYSLALRYHSQTITRCVPAYGLKLHFKYSPSNEIIKVKIEALKERANLSVRDWINVLSAWPVELPATIEPKFFIVGHVSTEKLREHRQQ